MTAESQNKRQHWRMLREDAATEGMRVEQSLEGWLVVSADGVLAGPFATNADAWKWVGRVPSKRYG